MNEKLEQLKHFFVTDAKIKKRMNELVPPQINSPQSAESRLEYAYDLHEFLKETYQEFETFTKEFMQSKVLEQKIHTLRKKTTTDLLLCRTDLAKQRAFYQTYISDMQKSFLNHVKEGCVGYTFRFPTEAIQEAISVNELLHLFHMYIMNQTDTYKKMPILEEKTNDFSYSIRAVGEPTELLHTVFEKFPLSIDVGWTDILSIEPNLIIMMIRDRGHALTIELKKEENKFHVDYFIPKICNLEMVNNLKGINKVGKEDPGATGSFEMDELEELYDFIGKVPMDSDMEMFQKNK